MLFLLRSKQDALMGKSKLKKRNYIDVSNAIELMRAGYGLKPKVFNFYQIRIHHEETKDIWDWYHTTGSLVRTADGVPARDGTFDDAEDVAIHIQRQVYQ